MLCKPFVSVMYTDTLSVSWTHVAIIVPKKSNKFLTPPMTTKNNPMTSIIRAIEAKTLRMICIVSIVLAGRFFLWNLIIWKMIVNKAMNHSIRKMTPEMNANVLVPCLVLQRWSDLYLFLWYLTFNVYWPFVDCVGVVVSPVEAVVCCQEPDVADYSHQNRQALDRPHWDQDFSRPSGLSVVIHVCRGWDCHSDCWSCRLFSCEFVCNIRVVRSSICIFSSWCMFKCPWRRMRAWGSANQ